MRYYPLGHGEEMSEGAYQAAIDDDCSSFPAHAPSRNVWTTKDGTQVRISKMTDGHLINTIRYLRRKAEAAQFHCLSEAAALGCLLSGEQASADCDAFVEHLEAQHPSEWLEGNVPQYLPMLREARRRKLGDVREQIDECL